MTGTTQTIPTVPTVAPSTLVLLTLALLNIPSLRPMWAQLTMALARDIEGKRGLLEEEKAAASWAPRRPPQELLHSRPAHNRWEGHLHTLLQLRSSLPLVLVLAQLPWIQFDQKQPMAQMGV